MIPDEERRPALGKTGRREMTAGGHVGTSVPRAGDGQALDDTAAAHAVRDALVVVVLTAGGHVRRRVYLNLPSATAAVERARERGHDAEVVLCRLEPIEPAPGPRALARVVP